MTPISHEELRAYYESLIDVLWDFEGVTLQLTNDERWARRHKYNNKIAEIEEFIAPFRYFNS